MEYLGSQSEFVDIEQALVQPASRRVDAFVENYEKPRLIPLHAEFADHLSQLQRVLPKAACFDIVSRADEDSVWVVRTNSDQGSPAYFLFEKELGEATFLFEEQPALSKYPLSQTHPKRVQARDGLDMVSYLTLPREYDNGGMPNKPLPTVLLVHGGPWMRDSWGFRPLPQTLANRGYAVLQVNFRGSTGFGKSFVNAGNFEWGKAMQDDLLDAVEWLVSNGVALRERIAIMGGSYESPRVSRRLQNLRKWSHGKEKQVLTRGEGASSTTSGGKRTKSSVALGGSGVGGRENRLFRRNAA